MDYIKKLRACIRQFQELETNITLEKDDLRRQLDDEKESREQSGEIIRSGPVESCMPLFEARISACFLCAYDCIANVRRWEFS